MHRVIWMKVQRHILLALSLWLLAFPGQVSAQGATKPEAPTLTVSGTGNLAVAPDMAFVTFGMETAGKSLTEAQRRNNSVMQKVMERLRELHIQKERIQTSSFTVVPQYKSPSKRLPDAPSVSPEIIGYLVGNSVTVEVDQLEKVAVVIEESLTAGANRFQGLHWSLRDEQQARLAALKQAAIKARERAAVLSEALRVKLVRLLSVQEGGHVIRPVSQISRSMMAMDAGGGEPPIFAGELQVEATVTLVYEIVHE